VRVAINGIGIAGPTLAYWLGKFGHDVLLVEHSPRLRTGGYVVDFWGIGYDIVEKMGLLPRILELGYRVEEVRFVDRSGRKVGGFAADVFSSATNNRFTSLARSDVSGTIYDALDPKVERLFGDSIAEIHDDGYRVRVRFDHAEPREFDLVIGADGLHSRVRQLAFDDASWREVGFGFHVAAFQVEGYAPRDELVYVTYGVPGRQVSRFAMRGDKTMFLFVFRDEHLPAGARLGRGDQDDRAILRKIFGGLGWECSRILASLDGAHDLYFDRVSQIRMDRWTRGRVALVGDAAACVSLLAGEGTGLAIAEAYTLAGEINNSGGNYADAFTRYENRLMPFIASKQASAAGFASSFAPKTALGLRFRNLVTKLLGIRQVAEFFLVRNVRDDVSLPDYELQSGPSA
jgi:2-polyprenyl-6-methoxyphenol hydroxylase-like FAD-dependent oxidoreductase